MRTTPLFLVRRSTLARFPSLTILPVSASIIALASVSHYGGTDRIVVPSGEEARFISPLPVQGLRLDEAECALLKRLGLGSIGQLLDLPRSALRARLGLSVLLRLDQALGEQSEPLSPLQPETVYAAHLNFAEPISSLESLAYATEHLAKQATAQLKRDAKGARRFRLTFYDTQGARFAVFVALAEPSHERLHLLRLFREKFIRLESRFDDSLAFDAASLYAMRIERITSRQSDLDGGDSSSLVQQERLAALLDRLSARLGSDAVTRFDFREIIYRSVRHSPCRSCMRSCRSRRFAAKDHCCCCRTPSRSRFWPKSRIIRRDASPGGASAIAW